MTGILKEKNGRECGRLRRPHSLHYHHLVAVIPTERRNLPKASSIPVVRNVPGAKPASDDLKERFPGRKANPKDEGEEPSK